MQMLDEKPGVLEKALCVLKRALDVYGLFV